MFRPLALLSLLLAIGLAAVPDAVSAQQPPKAPAPEKHAYLSSPGLIATGMSLLKDKNLAINTSIDFRPSFPVFVPRISLVSFNLQFASRNKEYDELVKAQAAINDQLRRETNELLKHQLEIQKKQLVVQGEQLKVAVEQAKIQTQLLDQAVSQFNYQKKQNDSLLRQLDYSLPSGKLVVVVADFSCGDSPEGVEIADEIANGLKELKEKGIDIEILVGEIKRGVVIRNERMALDIGQHFPNGTSYAVIWGTLSPRTVGKFRPYVTCAMKVDDERGLSRSYTIDIGNPDLPLPRGDTPEEQRRDQHRQLVAFACAVIPGCYASYNITQDKPNGHGLDEFLAFLDKGDEETKKIARQYRLELEPLTRWINTRSGPKQEQPKYEYLQRLTPVSKDVVYPRLVRNTKDNSMMTLITEKGTERPKRFSDKNGDYIVYIDVTETTNRQLVAFLNAEGNQVTGREATWVKIEPEYRNILVKPEMKAGRDEYAVISVDLDLERPAFNINHPGAEAYCSWAGKALPKVDEWKAAAAPDGNGKYPWGEKLGDIKTRCANKTNALNPFPTYRVGQMEDDTSRIGCRDMAGNVSEWCEEFADNSGRDRKICGGNIVDTDPATFTTDRVFSVNQMDHYRWLGFRGVVRIHVPPEPKP